MQCNECREHFVDLLYAEQGTASASQDALEHLDSCPSCKNELAALKGLQSTLKIWKDEPPLRPVAVPKEKTSPGLWAPLWGLARYAAVAALIVAAFLALANARISLGSEWFLL